VKLDPINWSILSGEDAGGSEGGRTSEFVDAQMSLSAPRHLLTGLRDVMTSEGSVEDRLSVLVSMIGKELRADACTCFVLRAGEVLEMFAATGFPEGMVRNARLRVGEGLIGDIAATAMPVILPDMSLASGYQPRPETGDDAFRSMAGVPILRGGRVRGVLVIHNKMPRSYGAEVIDILQTTALVIAEMIVTSGVLSRNEIGTAYTVRGKPTHMAGVSLGRGIAIGTAVLYEPGISIQNIVVDDVKNQKTRLRQALASMHDSIDRMLHKNSQLEQGSESRDILEAYQMFAKDRGWLSKIESAIDKGLSAEAAVSAVQNETRVRMSQMQDAYLRERLQDLEDLSNRLLSHLFRYNRDTAGRDDMPDNIVLVARSLGPAALLDYDHAKLKGVILEQGSQSNHVAIVARSLGIPVVGQCRDILNLVSSGEQVIVDGDHGYVYARPSEYILDLYTRSIQARANRTNLYRRQLDRQQTITKDGLKISVMMNAGLMPEIDAVNAVCADGVGLFRTELSFMSWQKYPLVVTQAELYGKILDKMGDKPVTFRTLDIGGDKPLPYFKAPEEENPALGWRAVRIGMDRPAVLRTQFRAFIRGAKGRNIRIMLPFVTEIAEFDRARQLLEMEKQRARDAGFPVPEKIELGIMLEVPALLWQLDVLLPSLDFVSVGTNDLMQYLYAADRGNFSIRTRYDALSPSMLKVLKEIADKCNAAKVPVSVCGEMAGQPLEAMVLIALGFQTLSVPAQSVENIKMMVPSIDTRRLKPYLDHLMKSREHSLRERLMSFARDHDINVSQDPTDELT
jgi:phosphotransferase system enzyme I (PtsP)